MKKHYFISLILIALILKVQAQNRFVAGAKFGLSTSQVAGDTYGGFNKAGLAGGITLKTKSNEKWSGQFEMLFIQKGSAHVGDATKGDYTYYKMQLNYIEVPVLLQYHHKKFTFEVGPGFGYLINDKEYNELGLIPGTAPFNKTEISYNIGMHYPIYKSLSISWRYSNSLTAIRTHFSGASLWFNPGQRNNVVAFTLTYTFENNGEE